MEKRGRPTLYTEELVVEICDRLGKGESLRSICRDDHMPVDSAVRQWALDDRNGFYARYTRARDLGLDVMADQVLEISDDGQNDWMESHDPENPGYKANGEHMQRSRLRFDARRWYLSKLAPKRYGDKQAVEISGPDGGPVELSDTQLAAKLDAIAAAVMTRREATLKDSDDGGDLV